MLSSLNASAQVALPGWVRARGMATYLLVFQGGQALGSVVWGLLATQTSTAVGAHRRWPAGWRWRSSSSSAATSWPRRSSST